MKFFLTVSILFLSVSLTHAQRFQRVANSIAEMVASNPSQVHTNVLVTGYYSAGDGGGASYAWYLGDTSSTNIGPVKFASTYPTAPAGRYIMIEPLTDIRQMGAVPGSTNWSTTVQRAINAATTNAFSFLIPAEIIWNSASLVVTNSGSIDSFAGWDQAPVAGPTPVSGERVRYVWGNRGGGAVNEQRFYSPFHTGLILEVDPFNPSQDSIFSGQNRTNPAKASLIFQNQKLDTFLHQYVNHTNATDYSGMVIQPFWATVTMTGVTSASFTTPPVYREYIKGATSGAYGYVVSISSSNIVVHWKGNGRFVVGENLADSNETSTTVVATVSPSPMSANTQGNLLLFDDNEYGQLAFGSIKALLAPWNFHGLVSLQGTRDSGQTVKTNYPYGGLLMTASEEAATPNVGMVIFRDDLNVLHLNNYDIQLGDTNTFVDPQGLARTVLLYGSGNGAGYALADTNALWTVLTSNGLLNFGDSNTTDVIFTQAGAGLFASGLSLGSLTNVPDAGSLDWVNDGVVTSAYFDGTLQTLYFTNAAIALQMGAPTNLLALDANGVITNVANLVNLTYDPSTRTLTSSGGGSGSVTNFSVGTMSPIFTVSNPTTFPTLAAVDPGATRLWAWDDTDGVAQQVTIGSGLSYDAPSNTLSATAGGGGTVTDVLSGNITNLWTVAIATSTTTPTFTFTRVDPGADRIVIFDNTNDQYVQAVIGSGLSYDQATDTLTATGGSGDITSVGDVSSGAAFDGTQGTILTFNNAGGDGTFQYDGTSFILTHPLDLGAAGVRLSGDGDGAITFLGLGNGTDENLILNLDDTANEAVFSSGTGVTNVNLSANTLSLSVPNFAYDATTWNGLQTVPTRDDIRDIVIGLGVINTNGLEGWQAIGAGTDFSYSIATATYEKIAFGTSGPSFTLTNAGKYQITLNIGAFDAGSFDQDFYLTNITDGAAIPGTFRTVAVSTAQEGRTLPIVFQVTTTAANKSFELWGQTHNTTYTDAGVYATNTVLDVVYLGNPTLAVVGPGSSTDEALMRWDGTGGATAQNSNVTLSDAGLFTFPDGVRQTFNPDGTNAGINVGSQAGDPGSPSNGDLWYDSTANELTARINGSNVALGGGGSSDNWVASGTTNSTLPGIASMNTGIVTNDLSAGSVTVTTNATVSGKVRIADGTAANPSLVFTSDDDGSGTGIYRSAANQPSISQNGVEAVRFVSGIGLQLQGDIIGLGGASGPNLRYRRNGSGVAMIDNGISGFTTLQLGPDDASPDSIVTVRAANGSGSNIDGGDIGIDGGRSTGSGRGGAIIIRTSPTGASGSSLNAIQNRYYVIPKAVTLTESTATTVANVAIASGQYCGIRVHATTFASDATDHQATTDYVNISAVNKAGTVTAAISTPGAETTSSAVSAGTLANTWTAVANGDSVDIKVSSVSSLTQTTLECYLIIELNGTGTLTVTEQ